jgi:ABC-type transporter Mla subunit MlaD
LSKGTRTSGFKKWRETGREDFAMDEQGKRFQIGVFLLTSVILLAVIIMLFGSAPGLFASHDRYYIVFDHAQGVAPGTPVRRSGVRIGQVEKVDLDDATGKVRVTILIDKKHHLYEGDEPVLVQGALSGDTSIDFIPSGADNKSAPADKRVGQADITQAFFLLAQAPANKGAPPPPAEPIPVKPGTEFKGKTQAGLQDLTKLSPAADDTLKEMRKLLDRYQQMTPLIEQTIREYHDLAKATRDVVPELRRTNDEVRELAKASRETIPELRRTNDEIQVTARNWGKLGERLDVLLQANQDKLVKTLDNMNDAMSRIANTFNEENQRNLSVTLRNVTAGSKNLESISRNTDELMKESRRTVARVNDSVTQADQVLANLQQATKPMAERSAVVMKNLDESTARLNRSMVELQEFLRAVNREDGTFRRLVNDPSLYNNLNETACMLTRILPRLDRVLRDLEVFADKIARHPESLGLGGIVTPSSGLKEGPSHWNRPTGH